MQELGKFSFKINLITNELEKFTSFTINYKLAFVHSFQFLSSLLNSLVNNLRKVDFMYLSQEFDSDSKGFYPYEYMCRFDLRTVSWNFHTY